MSVKTTCETCGETVERRPSKIADRTFCSHDCRAEWQSTEFSETVELTCDYCGETFEVVPSHAAWRRFCSMECYGNHRGGQSTLECEHCGDTFQVRASQDEQRFCSVECAHDAGAAGRKRSLSREAYAADIERVADIVGGMPSLQDYREYGNHAVSSIYEYFDSWPDARDAADIEGELNHGRIPRRNLILDLRGLWLYLGRIPTTKDYQEQGRYSLKPFQNRFGGWPTSLQAAGVE